MKRLAVIIPGYNCGSSIRRCLISIISQIGGNDIVIFIDDGSEDLTAEIVKKEFPQVLYVFQKNAGVSAARNRGLELASGFQYIMFVDSDDWLNEKCLYEFQIGEDMEDFTFCDWEEYKIDPHNSNNYIIEKCSFRNYFQSDLTVDDVRKHFLRSRSGGSPWGKVYNNSILQQYGIRFIEGLPYAEDYLFNLEYLKYAKSVKYVSKYLYVYNCSVGGARARFRKNRCELTIQIEKKKASIYDIKNDNYAPLVRAEMVEQFAAAFLNLYNPQFPKS